VFAQEMYEAWMPNQAPKDGFTAFSGANSQNLRRSLIVLNSYSFSKTKKPPEGGFLLGFFVSLFSSRLLKFVFEAANTRQKQATLSVTYRRNSPRGAYSWYA